MPLVKKNLARFAASQRADPGQRIDIMLIDLCKENKNFSKWLNLLSGSLIAVELGILALNLSGEFLGDEPLPLGSNGRLALAEIIENCDDMFENLARCCAHNIGSRRSLFEPAHFSRHGSVIENGQALLVALIIGGIDVDFTLEKNDHPITDASFFDQDGTWITVNGFPLVEEERLQLSGC